MRLSEKPLPGPKEAGNYYSEGGLGFHLRTSHLSLAGKITQEGQHGGGGTLQNNFHCCRERKGSETVDKRLNNEEN